MALVLTSSAFSHQGSIPSLYTCEGRDVSPPLAWSGVPAGARSLALVVDDPDAPDPAAPKRTWVHWVLYDIPVATLVLPEGVASSNLPRGTREGTNDWGRTGYGGPGALRKVELEKVMEGHVLAKAELIGTYEKTRV
jgi:Raf kinase inhibitor-like YbhB/YbcL family protein